MYQVQKSAYDASRPFAVVATFRSFNRVIARYATEASAKRRARDMNVNSVVRAVRASLRAQREE